MTKEQAAKIRETGQAFDDALRAAGIADLDVMTMVDIALDGEEPEQEIDDDDNR